MIYDGMRFRKSRAYIMSGMSPDGRHTQFIHRASGRPVKGTYGGSSLLYGEDGRVYLGWNGRVHISSTLKNRATA